MKIAWASHTSSLGGADLCFLEAAGGLISRGHEVHAILPSTGELGARLQLVGASVSVVPFYSWAHTGRLSRPIYFQMRRLPDHFRAVANLAKLLEHVNPDVLVTNTITIPDPAMAARRLGLPHVWYIHEFGAEDHRAAFDYGGRLSVSLMDHMSDRIIVNSSAVMRKYGKHFSFHKLRLIHCAVEVPDVTVPANSADKTLKLILVGRTSPGKGQEDAIRAIALLGTRGRTIALTLVGSQDPVHTPYIRELSKTLGVADQVRFIPFTGDPYSYIAQSDVSLMCSRCEAFGRVTVEAMKLGKPVIGANSGGTPDLIRDGWNGYLYEPGNAHDLADKVAFLDGNRPLLEELGHNARNWARATFTLAKYTEELAQVFQEARDPL